jgi:hypothetical protein
MLVGVAPTASRPKIARWALEHRADTLVIDRRSPTVTGLPGPTL